MDLTTNIVESAGRALKGTSHSSLQAYPILLSMQMILKNTCTEPVKRKRKKWDNRAKSFVLAFLERQCEEVEEVDDKICYCYTRIYI